jgi:hypothetical protein
MGMDKECPFKIFFPKRAYIHRGLTFLKLLPPSFGLLRQFFRVFFGIGDCFCRSKIRLALRAAAFAYLGEGAENYMLILQSAQGVKHPVSRRGCYGSFPVFGE